MLNCETDVADLHIIRLMSIYLVRSSKMANNLPNITGINTRPDSSKCVIFRKIIINYILYLILQIYDVLNSLHNNISQII